MLKTLGDSRQNEVAKKNNSKWVSLRIAAKQLAKRQKEQCRDRTDDTQMPMIKQSKSDGLPLSQSLVGVTKLLSYNRCPANAAVVTLAAFTIPM
jgi:hypothetical protein